jgi:hypothetical protein
MLHSWSVECVVQRLWIVGSLYIPSNGQYNKFYEFQEISRLIGIALMFTNLRLCRGCNEFLAIFHAQRR